MNFIDVLKNDEQLSEWLSRICDVEVLEEYKKPEDEDSRLEYNINGKTFAIEGSGGEYILLNDGSIGFWGSEGQVGRIADNLEDFFEFIINCPYWQDYTGANYYTDINALSEFSKKQFEELKTSMKEDGIDLCKIQKYLAESLGVKLYANTANTVLVKFYNSAIREPRFNATFTEEDGSKHSSSGTLFSIPS